MSKREQLIRTAIKLFVKQGFEHTPTSQISKEAGVATGTLFHHFDTKEKLINEAYRYVKKSMASAIFRNIEGVSVEQQIKNLWYDMMKWGFEHKDENLFLARFYGSTYIDKLTVQQVQADMEPAHKILETAKKQRLIKDIPPIMFENIHLGLYHAFLKEFYARGKLDKKLLALCWRIAWDAMKK